MKSNKNKKKKSTMNLWNKLVIFIKGHKLVSILIAILLLILSGGCIFAFALHYDKKNNLCTIQFDTNGGSPIEKEIIKCGDLAVEPKKPTKDGFSFKYWSYDDKKFDFSTPINSNIVLKSIYELNEGTEIVVITFDTNGGSKIDPIEIKKGGILKKPLNPILEGQVFKGWYENYNEFDFSQPIYENKTLLARWEEKNRDKIEVNTSAGEYRCRASSRRDIPERTVSVGYSSAVGWTWDIGGGYGGIGENACYQTYKSSNPNIASVDSNGIITTVKPGIAYISQCHNDTDTRAEVLCFTGKLIVKPEEVVEIEDGEIWLINPRADKYTMEIGESQTLKLEISPEKYKPTTFTWSSSDDSIVRIVNSKTGKIEALKEGDVWIKVKTANGVEGSCPIHVVPKPVHVESITLDNTKLNLPPKKVLYLSAHVLPENATEKGVIWTSSNPDVATIDYFGLLQTKKSGITTITAETIDGNKKATCVVEVKDINVSSISLDVSSVEIVVGHSKRINATISPSDATNKTIIWTSSNTNVASVNNGSVQAVAPGNAVITATTQDGNKKATCNVTVLDDKVKGIRFENKEYTVVVNTQTYLKIVFDPEYARNKNVTWSSSNTTVADISAGNVWAHKKGTTIITAVSEDGGKMATCTVNVVNPPLSASASFFSNVVDVSGDVISRKVGVKVTATGGDPLYHYSINLYKDGVLVSRIIDRIYLNSIQIDDNGYGTYSATYTVTDESGNTFSGSIGPTSF